MSATPFYLHGSGYPEGRPFPWIVTDFGLVDAIESGIVKIPRLPVQDTTGRPDPKKGYAKRKSINSTVLQGRLAGSCGGLIPATGIGSRPRSRTTAHDPQSR